MSSVDRQKSAFCKGCPAISFVSITIILCLSAVFLTSVCCDQARAFPGTKAIAYTTNLGQNTVGVIDMDQGTLLGALPGYHLPFHLAVSPDSRRVYVLEADTDMMAVIDTSTSMCVANINLGGDPHCIALSPDGTKAYVTCDLDTVEIVDTAAGTRTGTIRAGSLAYGICTNPRTGDVYVLNTWDKSVSIIKGDGVVATVTLDGYLETGLAVTPDGNRLFVTDHYSKVYVIDTVNHVALANFSTGENSEPVSVVFSPDGASAYVACADGIKVFSTDSYDLVKKYSLSSPDRLVMGEGGRVLYALSSQAAVAVEAATGRVLFTVGVDANDIGLAVMTGTFTLPDVTPPVSTISLAGPVDVNAAIIGQATCTLTAGDNEGGTGVKSMEYRLPDRGWVTYEGPFNITVPGMYTMYYRATDNAGNVEHDRAIIVRIVSTEDAVTPSPKPCPTPSPTPAVASPTPTTVPTATASPTPTATTATPVAASSGPTAVPLPTTSPSPTATPAVGFEAVTVTLGIACAGYALTMRKR